MKKTILFICLFAVSFVVKAQSNQWKVKLNSKVVLNTSHESELKNVINVTPSEWKKKGKLEIFFTDIEPGAWIRSYVFLDDKGMELFRKDSVVNPKFTITELKKAFPGSKEIKIFTTVSPTNPNLAVRLRPVHLCTLRLP